MTIEISDLRRFAQFSRRSLLDAAMAQITVVRAPESAERRSTPSVVAELDRALDADGVDEVADRAAYTWFNRLCALRYMDVRGFNPVRIVSPADGDFQPQILTDAKAGVIHESLVQRASDRERVTQLLNGSMPSPDPQAEAYRILLTAACNSLHAALPFLFERVDEHIALLMPQDLLSGNSVLVRAREAMTPAACETVEVIGWLYQFYVSEKKDEVFDDLSNNIKVSSENIPAATQLFTPDWIVRYLVQNSLGRLWLENHPESGLATSMDFYIAPVESSDEYLVVDGPEGLKVCDPACGSGHMLTYAFDLLTLIYEEEGYDPAEIPGLILRHNLVGIEIDERAGQLAAFALVMKARASNRRFLDDPVTPNVVVLRELEPDRDSDELVARLEHQIDRHVLAAAVEALVDVSNRGSLLRPQPNDFVAQIALLETSRSPSTTEGQQAYEVVLAALKSAAVLCESYHVVVANPPYMGSRNMNEGLATWSKKAYPRSKSDLFAMFIERNLEFTVDGGYVAMITMQNWMFLSSYEKLRADLVGNHRISSMAHLGPRAFDSISGEVVSTTAFVLRRGRTGSETGTFIRLVDGKSESEKQALFRAAIESDETTYRYTATASTFAVIPSQPIAYWATAADSHAFETGKPALEILRPKQGLATGNNERFLRQWFEPSLSRIGFGCSNEQESARSECRWFPYNKGGTFRRWYGNREHVIDWEDEGEAVKDFKPRSVIRNPDFYFREGITWSDITTDRFAARHSPTGAIFDVKGSSGFPGPDLHYEMLALLNSPVTARFMQILNPTTTFQVGDLARIPVLGVGTSVPSLRDRTVRLVEISEADYNEFELSFDFVCSPLVDLAQSGTIESAYARARQQWRSMVDESAQLETENNAWLAESYGLDEVLEPIVQPGDVTLTINPSYRYGKRKSDADCEASLLRDSLLELLSYGVGCLFGRYSLDEPGLILANQGDTLAEYLERVSKPSLLPDEDNVLPILDESRYGDDIVDRFREFLVAAFGPEHLDENVAFIEAGLGSSDKPRSLRDYFLKDFYTDHIKTYKTRPIYWMFSSPKGTFNALIYMHRYRPGTLDVLLNDYLRDLRVKLDAQRTHNQQIGTGIGVSAPEVARASKEILELDAKIKELDDYERDVLFPLATQRIDIDLDEGVKANYPKFGKALKHVKGLSK